MALQGGLVNGPVPAPYRLGAVLLATTREIALLSSAVGIEITIMMEDLLPKGGEPNLHPIIHEVDRTGGTLEMTEMTDTARTVADGDLVGHHQGGEMVDHQDLTVCHSLFNFYSKETKNLKFFWFLF